MASTLTNSVALVELLGVKRMTLNPSKFTILPLELITEVAKLLKPADLLNLARTSKRLRRYLLDRRTKRTVWMPAVASDIGSIQLPESIVEPKLVNFISFTHCDECGLERVQEEQDNIYSFPEICVWLCRRCVRTRFAPSSEVLSDTSCLPCDIKHLHKLVPSVRGSLADRKLNWPPKVAKSEPNAHAADTLDRRYLYHIQSVISLQRQWADVPVQDSAHAKSFFKAKCEVMQSLRKFEEDAFPLIQCMMSDRKPLVEERVIQIQERLRALGFGNVASGFFQGSGPNSLEYQRKFGGRYKQLTDDEWLTIQTEIIALVKAEKERWVIFEKIRKVGERLALSGFQSAFQNFAFSQPPNTIFPTPLEVSLMPEWVDALAAEPITDPLSLPLVEKAVAAMPKFCAGVTRMRTEELLCLVRDSKTFQDREDEVTPGILALASTIFRCSRCNDVLHHPHVLAHHCNYSRPTDLRLKWWNPDAKAIEQNGEPGTWTMRPLKHSDMAVVGAFARFFDDANVAEQTWNHLKYIRFDDTAHEHALHLLDGLGMSSSTSVEQLEERHPYVLGLCPCFDASKNLMRWIKAIHICKQHAGKEVGLKWFSEPEAAHIPMIAEVESKRIQPLVHSCFWMPILNTRLMKPKRNSRDDLVADHFEKFQVEHPEGLEALRAYVKGRTLESSAGLKQERAIQLRDSAKQSGRK